MRLLLADPDLASATTGQRSRAAAERILAETFWLPPGRWAACTPDDPRHIGLLLLRGVLVRRTACAGRRSAELLGPGDVFRIGDSDDASTLEHSVAWQALDEVRIAVLDEALMSALSCVSGALAQLAGRLLRRSGDLALRSALSQTPNLETRLELVFWHLADRWGRRQDGRVILDVPLSQGLLGELVGARRTSVNTALQQLARRGRIVLESGQWALCTAPPQAGPGLTRSSFGTQPGTVRRRDVTVEPSTL